MVGEASTIWAVLKRLDKDWEDPIQTRWSGKFWFFLKIFIYFQNNQDSCNMGVILFVWFDSDGDMDFSLYLPYILAIN